MTRKPSASRCSAQARIDCGDPENPWQSSTPFGPDPP